MRLTLTLHNSLFVRHQTDPLGEDHINTWRIRIIKVAAEVIVFSRRIVIRLTSNWPYLKILPKVAQANASLATTCPASPLQPRISCAVLTANP